MSSTDNKFIVRVLGHGQFKVNKETITKIDNIDDAIVKIIETLDTNVDSNVDTKQNELKEKITEIINIIVSEGSELDDKEIVQSHIMIPNSDISIDDAKKIFKGEGIITEI